MGWVSLDSDKGSTDWRLFRRVTRQIEDMRQRASGLCLKKMVLYVDAEGRQSNYYHLTAALASRELLPLEFDGGVKQDIDRDLVLPGASEIKLTKGMQHRLQDNTINRVEAFFAKKIDDLEIDVQREAQLMMRIMRCCMNNDCGWECNVNPQPTIHDLISSIESAKQLNIRVLHLAGHCSTERGFEWNANDKATEIKTYDDVVVSALIGTQAAGQKGPIECVVLNACCSEKMGRMLRERGVPNVVCWKTPVLDETAREMCGLFFTALGTDKERKRDYKGAFAAAMNAMRPLSHTHGANDVPPTVAASASVDARGGQRGQVIEWQEKDVVLFLSNDGDNKPIEETLYLWRRRRAL
jgi:hypothetical protein